MSVASLPVPPPVSPMLAKATSEVPEAAPGKEYLYEPKWDGFRCIVFKDGDDVELGSRNERPLTRYFPEVVAAIRKQFPPRIVVDGEVVIVIDDHLDFERLLDRIHPADSRVQMLSEHTPASFVAFDLLAIDDQSTMSLPQRERRELLLAAMRQVTSPLFVTPATTDPAIARDWFATFEGAGLDGVVAKPMDLAYQPDKRVLLKIKHDRTADCVVAGFRWHKSGDVVGSLLLGLYDEDGTLHHVGVSASFPMERRRTLVAELEPYRLAESDTHPWSAWLDATEGQSHQRMPGGQTRWNAGKDLSWVPLRPELVCEVAYDHMQGDRFRHTAQFRRWRPDKAPTACTYDQLDRPVRFDLQAILAEQD